ncbi:unnamed protein product, partial [Amoebophrya sp. A25]
FGAVSFDVSGVWYCDANHVYTLPNGHEIWVGGILARDANDKEAGTYGQKRFFDNVLNCTSNIEIADSAVE